MKKHPGTLFVVDDNRAILTSIELQMRSEFERVLSLSDPKQLLAVLEQNEVDVLLLDMNFGAGIQNGNEGLYWRHRVQERYPDLPIVLFTAFADIDLAVRAVKEGAFDFLTKPWQKDRLVDCLGQAYRMAQTRKKALSAPITANGGGVLKSPEKPSKSSLVWGACRVMQELKHLLEKVSQTDANILITGENGTGKELLAREVHRQSKRAGGPCISVDMGAISESLFESELFGYVKGAFTDAKEDRKGKFEMAQGGSLFLDEIGNLSYGLQAKMLAVLQNRCVTPVGSSRSIPVDIRLICATNCDLASLVEQGKFRQDLFYRINTIEVSVPPLRERGGDRVSLADYFLQKYAQQYDKPDASFSPEALEAIGSYSWPGNVRELQNAVEKALILSDTAALGARWFGGDDWRSKGRVDDPPVRRLDVLEKEWIDRTLAETGGHISETASRLGISRQTLYNKMKKYGL